MDKIEHNLKHKARVHEVNVEIKKNISINKRKRKRQVMEEKVLYVGIDVAKAKFDVSFTIDGKECIYYQTIENEKGGFKKLVKEIKKIQKKIKVKKVHICMENTGIYHCELCEYLQKYSALIVSVVHPVRSKSFSKSLLIRTKNDKTDSMMLAQYAYTNKPKATPKLPENLKKFRTLVRYQNSLIKLINQAQGQIEACKDEEIEVLIKQNIEFLNQQKKSVIDKIETMIKSDEFLTKQLNLLKTVDGIGDKSAWVILAELKFDSIENLSPKAQVCNAGLSPRRFDSGSSVRGRSHISKMGKSLIRKVMFMPSLGCTKHENYFTSFYNRLRKNGKTHRQAQVAVMRKMLHTACGVLKNQTSFDKDWAKKTQEKYQENLKVS